MASKDQEDNKAIHQQMDHSEAILSRLVNHFIDSICTVTPAMSARKAVQEIKEIGYLSILIVCASIAFLEIAGYTGFSRFLAKSATSTFALILVTATLLRLVIASISALHHNSYDEDETGQAHPTQYREETAFYPTQTRSPRPKPNGYHEVPDITFSEDHHYRQN